MTCVIVDAEPLAGIASAAIAAPNKSNFLTVPTPSAVETPSASRLSHSRRGVNDGSVLRAAACDCGSAPAAQPAR
jgi:hypothetical protein